VRRIFDANADPAAIAARLGRDPALRASVRKRPGLRVPGAWDPFELTIRAILGQQVSVRGATTLAGRLASTFGRRLPAGAAGVKDPAIVFPPADVLAGANVASIGIPASRAAAIREVARRVAAGDLALDWGADPDGTRDALASVPGIGPWTAGYVAMRALALPDTFLDGDLGVLRALEDGDGVRPTPRQALARAEAWRPWRAYAVMHLWAGDAERSRPEREKGKEQEKAKAKQREKEEETQRCASTR
jgi:3-methyladenine DNA glycosylase/8-oxoguanine DNA glycosylase